MPRAIAHPATQSRAKEKRTKSHEAEYIYIYYIYCFIMGNLLEDRPIRKIMATN